MLSKRLADLERELALLAFHIQLRYWTAERRAAHANLPWTPAEKYGLERRVDTLIALVKELRGVR